MVKLLIRKLTALTLIPWILLGCLTFIAKAEDRDLSTPQTAVMTSQPDSTPDLSIPVKSCVLMEASTGKILYSQNPDEQLPPASVTKVMTLLLVMEALDSGKIKLDDVVTASADACSMGGSQIYLKENEQMTVDELLKSVVVASANDAAYALAEFVSGSETAFVKSMNEKASALGMEHTNFENTNGLDDTTVNHYTSAEDIAIMSRELIKHQKVLEYSSIWMDSIRNGAFGLTNTNRLVRFYKGCNGLKTGSTSKAGFCISATAERDGMTLICVIMGAETRDVRNKCATQLLDWGFANYCLYTSDSGSTQPISVVGGTEDYVVGTYGRFDCVLERNQQSSVTKEVLLEDTLSAPIEKGDAIGKIQFKLDGKIIGETEIYAESGVPRISFGLLLFRTLKRFLLI